MFESITMNSLARSKVVAAVDILKALQTAATSLKSNLMIFAAVMAVTLIALEDIFFFFGRRKAENGKTHVGYVLLGVGVILTATSVVVSMFSMFGRTP